MTARSSPAISETPAVGEIAYLTNVYPWPSHSFIRREILALENAGWRVHRFAHRADRLAHVEPADEGERRKTCVLLDLAPASLAGAVLAWLVERPLDTAATFALAMHMARHGDRRYIAHTGYFVMACALSRRLRRSGCHHVHAHFGTNPAAVACLAHRLCGLRYSVTFHGPHEFDPALRLNLRKKIEAASFIAVVSQAAHQRVLHEYPEFHARFRRVPCGLDAAWFSARQDRTDESRQLVCVARLEPQKNPLLLLDAARLLVERGLAFRLTLIGDGALRPALQAFIHEHALSGHVVLIGWQAQRQVVEHLQTARALVLSSDDEGLPVAIMEAFALGVPAIATDVGGVHELVQTGASGWLVPRGNARALADAMSACLLAGPDELRRLGAEARRRVEDRDIRSCARTLAAAFREAADTGPTPARWRAGGPAQ